MVIIAIKHPYIQIFKTKKNPFMSVIIYLFLTLLYEVMFQNIPGVVAVYLWEFCDCLWVNSRHLYIALSRPYSLQHTTGSQH